jgi:hypothetical protein
MPLESARKAQPAKGSITVRRCNEPSQTQRIVHFLSIFYSLVRLGESFLGLVWRSGCGGRTLLPRRQCKGENNNGRTQIRKERKCRVHAKFFDSPA